MREKKGGGVYIPPPIFGTLDHLSRFAATLNCAEKCFSICVFQWVCLFISPLNGVRHNGERATERIFR